MWKLRKKAIIINTLSRPLQQNVMLLFNFVTQNLLQLNKMLTQQTQIYNYYIAFI